MNKISAVIILALCIGTLAQRVPDSLEQQGQGQGQDQPKRPLYYPEYLLVPNCQAGYPYFSAGDIVIADSNYTK